MNTNIIYDVLIVGAGPAGMTAAIYAGRADKTVAIIDKDGFGGNIAKSPKVENIPGFTSISGIDFATNMYEQVMNQPTITHFINEVVLVNYRYGLFKLYFEDGSIVCGRSLIFAVGTKHRELNLDTPDIYYCVTCDGPMFKNKNVVVVGSGNSGSTYALELAKYCKNVYLCDVTQEMCCEATLRARVENTKNIFWLPNCTIDTVTNNKEGRLTSVTLSTTNVLKCNAIFAAIGLIPQTAIAAPFTEIDDRQYIISTDCTTKNIPGVFVAGDCRTNKVKQVVTAVSDGATAAIEAMKFLDSQTT